MKACLCGTWISASAAMCAPCGENMDAMHDALDAQAEHTDLRYAVWSALLDDLTLEQFHQLLIDLWVAQQPVTFTAVKGWRKRQDLPITE